MNKQQIQSFIEKMKVVISELETTINTDKFISEKILNEKAGYRKFCNICHRENPLWRESCMYSGCQSTIFYIADINNVLVGTEIFSKSDDKIIKPEDYHFNDTGETIHAGQPVNIYNCCGNITKSTTKAVDGEYYCNICINDVTADIYQVRRFCAICGIKLQGFYNVNSPDDLKCQGCINSLQKEGAVINDGEI